MLDDLAVLEPEDINDRCAFSPRLRDAVDMQDHEITVGEDPLDLAAVLGRSLPQGLNERLESFDAIRDTGVVLDVLSSEMLCCGFKILLVYALFVKVDDDLLVRLQLRSVRGPSPLTDERSQRDDTGDAHGFDHDLFSSGSDRQALARRMTRFSISASCPALRNLVRSLGHASIMAR